MRRAVLTCIGMFKSTLPSILKRTKDVKEDVRRLVRLSSPLPPCLLLCLTAAPVQAYNMVAQKLNVKQLSIKQRQELMADGLTDRNEEVRTAAQGLLSTTWFGTAASDHVKVSRDWPIASHRLTTPRQLLEMLDVEVSEKVGEEVVKELLRTHVEICPTLPASHNDLTKESAFLFRVACDFFTEQKMEERLDKTLPPVRCDSDLCRSRH